MEQTIFTSILKMRFAVYKAGIKAGVWKDINQSDTYIMMDCLFPKSGMIAYYNLIMEQMRAAHAAITGGSYYLFKMPVHVEKQIVETIRKEQIELLPLSDDFDDYLRSMDTIATDHCLGPVNIGSFDIKDIDSLLRLCAAHYRYAFANNVQSFPYFD